MNHNNVTASPAPTTQVASGQCEPSISPELENHQPDQELEETPVDDEADGPQYIFPETSHCPGCGAGFHQGDSKLPGFLPNIKGEHEMPPDRYLQKRFGEPGSKMLSDREYQNRVEQLEPELRQHFGVPPEKPANTTPTASTSDLSSSSTTAFATEPTESEVPEPLITAPPTSARRIICKRCHDLVHYNRVSPHWHSEVTTDPNVLSFLQTKNPALVLHVFDLFDLPGSLLKGLANYIGKQHSVILVANKLDLLPKDVHLPRLATYVQRLMKDSGIFNIIGLHLVSARKVHGVRELCADLVRLRRTFKHRHCDIYMVGRANVGKSELVNAMLRISYGGSPHKVTAFPVPGTTSEMLKIPLERFKKVLVDPKIADAGTLFDTPGIFNNQSLVKYLTYPELKATWPPCHLKPLTYAVKPGQSICLGGMGRVDVLECPERLFFTVFSNVPVHITQITKAKAMIEAMAQGESTVLQPPVMDKSRAAIFPTMRFISSHTLSNDHSTMACTDVYFAGLGWLAIAGRFDRAVVHLFSAGGLGCGLRPPILPFEYRYKLAKQRSNMRKQK
ncbi:nitric oxide associated protein 1 [Dimargaris cristalligena]|nr:nitric oxide associated protein 1 [Dimargaris cristalligena]